MSLPFWSLLVAAGAGSRLGGTQAKQYRLLAGEPLLLRALAPWHRHGDPERLILVVPPGDEEFVAELVAAYDPAPRIVAGGATRQDSVSRGLAAIPDADGWVAVHDAARPLFDGALLPLWRERLESMGDKGALVPVLPVTDTVLRLSSPAKGSRPISAEEQVDRSHLGRVQTPQLFRLPLLRRAHAAARARGETAASDDGSLVLAMGETLGTLPGDPGNFKITTPADLDRAEALWAAASPAVSVPRSGMGYDSHRFAPDRPLILGGVDVPSDVGGLVGHSDADVLTHALMDALLGAAALGDIGVHFPDSDEAFAGADSLALLAHVMQSLAAEGLRPAQVDLTLIAERPRLAEHIPAMRARLAEVLDLPLDRVSVKATSNEGMGAIGRGEGMAALALATLRELPPLKERP